jgi:hypothetical protein
VEVDKENVQQRGTREFEMGNSVALALCLEEAG